jgi:hypothetical protein
MIAIKCTSSIANNGNFTKDTVYVVEMVSLNEFRVVDNFGRKVTFNHDNLLMNFTDGGTIIHQNRFGQLVIT